MGRKRKNPKKVKGTFCVSMRQELIDELKEKYDVPSNIIEQLVEEYLSNKRKKGDNL